MSRASAHMTMSLAIRAVFVLVACAFMCVVASAALADDEIVAASPADAHPQPILNAIPDHSPALSIHEGAEGDAGEGGLDAQEDDSLPTSYDAREVGHSTPVKDQGGFGLCWAFSSTAALESSLLSHGQGALANDGSLPDLSERHLAYFTYHPATDPLGYTDGDRNDPVDTNYMEGIEAGGEYLAVGGNPHIVGYALAAWRGAVDEERAPFSALERSYNRYLNYKWWLDYRASLEGEDPGWEAPEEYPFSTFLADTNLAPEAGLADASWHLSGFHHIALSDRADVKRAVVEYGGASMLMLYDEACFNSETASYYNSSSSDTNHVVTIVGWDDDFAKESFASEWSTQTKTPENDGAWLCKNSWGTWWGDEGYFWLSYDDASQKGRYAKAFVYDVVPADTYDNVYQHDGTSSVGSNTVKSGGSIANVYKAHANEGGAEVLEAVGFALDGVNVDYSVQVYLNLRNRTDPTSGSPALAQPIAGKTSYAGYYTIPLGVSVPLQEGAYYSVVVTVSRPSSSSVAYAVDSSTNEWRWVRFSSSVHVRESFERDSPDGLWKDLAQNTGDSVDKSHAAARVKAFTRNVAADDLPPLSFDGATIELGTAAFGAVYSGRPICPVVSVSYGGTPLLEGIDYQVSYADNVAGGKARVMVEPLGVYCGAARVLPFTIAPAKQAITVKGATKVFGAKPFSLGARALGGAKLTYSSSNRKVVTVDSAGKVTVRGAGTAKITVKTAATSSYRAASKVIAVKVAKAAQPLRVTAKSPAVCGKPGGSLPASKVLTVKSAKGAVTYAKTSGSKFVTVAKSGRLSVKKGTKPGVYKLHVRVSAAGNANHKPGSRIVAVSVRV